MISKEMEKALFTQLNDEFYSAYLYLAMSAYCSHLEFNGAAEWLKLQYEEEHIHATKIYNYLVEQGVQVVLEELFAAFMEDVNTMPQEFAAAAAEGDEAGRARVVADYIAGMTDRYAFAEHERISG